MKQTGSPLQESGERAQEATQIVEQLVQDYGKLVFHMIHGMTGDWLESQDLTQDVFLQALAGIERARAVSGPRFQARAWLLRIAVNLVRMHRRRERVYRILPFSVVEGEQNGDAEESGTAVVARAAPVQPPGYAPPEAENPAEVVAERDAVERTLARLPESLRLPLLLSIVAGCSHAEVARILALQEVTVRQRLSRARRAFQAFYIEECGEVIKVDTQEQRGPTRGRDVPGPATEVQAAAG